MIDTVAVLEPRGWFDNHLRRRLEPWREGMVVADLFTRSPVDRMAFRVGGRMARADDQVAPGDVVIGIESPGAEAVVAFVIDVIIAAAVGYVVSKLIGPPKPPKAIGDESKPSESFTFGGTRTIYSGSGVPLPIVYGERAVGGVVIGFSVVATGSPQPQQVLTILLALCTGPVESVAGFTADQDDITGSNLPDDLLINENPASSYSGIEVAVRLGTADQTAIAGAPTATVESSIGLPLTNVHIDDALPAVTDWSNAVVYTMPEDGDGFLATIAFNGGLYNGGGASIQPETAEFELRYRRVDDFGVPFGDYWPGGAADPELGIQIPITRALLSPFAESYFFPLYDPAQPSTVLPPEAISLPTDGASGAYLDSDGASGGTWALDGQTVESYSVEMFVQPYLVFNGSVYNDGLLLITDEYPQVGNSAIPHDPDGSPAGPQAFKGLGIYARPGGNNDRFIGFYWGDGSGVGEGVGWVRCEASTFPIDVSNPNALDIVHIVCTFERDIDGLGTNRGRLYLNGTLQATKLSTIEFEWPATADLFEYPVATPRGPVLINQLQGAQQFDIVTHVGHNTIDRVVFYSNALDSTTVFEKYNDGEGDIPDLSKDAVEAWWEMGNSDLLITGTETVMLDRSNNGHDLRIYQGAWFGTGKPTQPVGPGGPLIAGFAFDIVTGFGTLTNYTGVNLRSRYEISVQRVDLVEDSDEISDKATLQSVTIFTSTDFSYPGIALLTLRLPAQDQLSDLRPNISVPVRGLQVPIWDGISETNPTYNLAWSQNNAWIALDMLTSKHTGLDRFHDLTRTPIIARWKAWADFCDELVDDLFPVFDLLPTTATGSIDLLAQSLPGGNALRLLTPATGRGVPSNWAIGDWVYLSGMPGAQVSLGYPNDQLLQIVDIDSFAGFDNLVLAWPTTPAYPPSSFSETVAKGTIMLNRYEARSEADIVLDAENQSAWEYVLEVCNAGRAIPVRVGDQVSIAFQGVRSPVQMFSDANILPGTVTLSSATSDEEFNSVDFRFFNRLKQFRRDSMRVDHPDLSDGSNTQAASRSFSSSVVTRASQIARDARYQLNLNKLTTEWIEFETSTEALAIEPGDVFLFSGSDPAYGFAGRLPAQVDIGATSLTLDVDVNLDSGITYNLAVLVQDGTIEQTVVTATAGYYAAGDSISISPALAGTGLRDAHWAIGSLATVNKLYQVASIEMTDDLTFVVRGAIYNADVYDETGFAELPTESGSELYDPTSGGGFPPPLAAVSVEEVAGPSPFGTVGSTGILVSVQHLTTSTLLGTVNKAGNSGSVVVTARPIGSGLEPVTLGTIPAGSTYGVFQLEGGQWSPGTLVEVSAAPSSPTGAAGSPSRARKARVRLSGRGPMPTAPRALTATQTGSSVIYYMTPPLAAQRSRPVRGEVRAGGWICGQHVISLDPGEASRPTDAWFTLPTGNNGRSNPPLYARYLYGNGQWSDVYKLTGFAPTAPGTVLDEDSFEVGGWDVVTGDSGSVAFSEMENNSAAGGEEILRFTAASTSLTGSWTSPEWDVGSERECAVFFAIEAGQIHPILYQDAVMTWRDIEDWTVEGPISDFPDVPTQYQGQVSVALEIAYSGTATPGTNWQEYRPGIYTARSFAFRIRVTRPTDDFNVEIYRGAFRITEPAQLVSFGGSL